MFKVNHIIRNGFSLGLLLLVCLSDIALAAVQPENLDLETLIDPTAPLNLNRNSGQDQTSLFNLVANYKVNSILIRPNMKVAVINSRQVREGEMIGNAEIARIDKNSVTLIIAGEEQVLELYGKSIKTINQGEE